MCLATLILTVFTVVELNCENIFDLQHDSLKNDYEWVAGGENKWSAKRYWRKLNRTAQTIIACGERNNDWALPDIVALCEIENDSVMRDLTRRSLLRKARYDYVMTDSPDLRGIDVALLYSPFTFRLINQSSLRIDPLPTMKPTRDILYVSGEIISGDTLHIFVVHAPSRRGGEHLTRSYRCHVASRIVNSIDSIRELSPKAKILVMGDFNDYSGDPALLLLENNNLIDISKNVKGLNGAKGTYRYKGRWDSLDHIFASEEMGLLLMSCYIYDAKFLMEKDRDYGGLKPRRTYYGIGYNNGFSDHLPLVAHFQL